MKTISLSHSVYYTLYPYISLTAQCTRQQYYWTAALFVDERTIPWRISVMFFWCFLHFFAPPRVLTNILKYEVRVIPESHASTHVYRRYWSQPCPPHHSFLFSVLAESNTAQSRAVEQGGDHYLSLFVNMCVWIRRREVVGRKSSMCFREVRCW